MEVAKTFRKGAKKHCCWGTCKSDSRYREKMPEGTEFLRFPKPGTMKDGLTEWEKKRELEKTEKAKRWLHACGRKDFCSLSDIKKDTYICSIHFYGGKGPTEDHPDPVLATLTREEVQGRLIRAAKRLRAKQARESRVLGPSDPKKDRQKEDIPDSNETGCQFEESMMGTGEDEDGVDNYLQDKSTQTIYCKYTLGAKVETMIYKNQIIAEATNSDSAKSSPANLMSCANIVADDKKCKYFTGLDPVQFNLLFNFLGEAKYELRYWGCTESKGGDRSSAPQNLSVKEQLFLTLLRLRRGFNVTTIAYMYNLSESLVRKVFITWIQFLFHHFKDYKYLMFPCKEELQPYLPKIFRCFKNVRCSIDCTEFYCQMASDYGQQGNMYSSYKNHSTMKCLIAVTPNGAACFVSDLFEGSIDDVAIFRECGILDHINPFDTLLVDKGFTIQDLLLEKQASIHIPPFLGKRDCFTKEEQIMTKRIAKARIHVERFNERLKKFRLIGKIIPLNLSHIASQLVYVAACLVNFQPCLCK